MITHIIHLADLHFQNGDLEKARYREYYDTIQNLEQILTSLDCVKQKTCIIIICGDFFQIKNKIESSGIKLFNHFVSRLSKLAPMFIIQGNHDYRQDQPDSPDILSSLFHENPRHNVTYLADTGCYEIENIGLGVVSVRDTLVENSTHGLIDKLPDFPNDFSDRIKTRIALFHGTINSCRLQNFNPANDGYPIDWFQGYDICMLGDVHLQQVHNIDPIELSELSESSDDSSVREYKFKEDKMPWGYPGSLVQQNIGEPLLDHGFLLWNLEDKRVKTYHVKNTCGRAYIRYQDEEWLAYYGKWYTIASQRLMSLDKLLSLDGAPDFLLVNIRGRNTNEDLERLDNIFRQHSKRYRIEKGALNHMDDLTDLNSDSIKTDHIEGLNVFNSPQTWIQYIREKHNAEIMGAAPWEQWLLHPETLSIDNKFAIEEVADKVTERNKKISKCVDRLQENLTGLQSKKSLKLKYLQWQWMFCYADNCWINFEDVDQNVFIINGDNSYGKSSFLEIICLALYGENIPSRYSKKYSGGVVCCQKPTDESAFTLIEFQLESQKYKIYRGYEKQNNQLKCCNISLYAVDSDEGQSHLLKKDRLAVKEWIAENIGTVDQFLLTTMLTQNSDKDFFSLGYNSQIELLDKSLNLESIKLLDNVLKETANAHKYLYEQLETLYKHLDSDAVDFDSDRLACVRTELATTQSKIDKFKVESMNIKETWHDVDEPDLKLSDKRLGKKIKLYQSRVQNIPLELTELVKYETLFSNCLKDGESDGESDNDNSESDEGDSGSDGNTDSINTSTSTDIDWDELIAINTPIPNIDCQSLMQEKKSISPEYKKLSREVKKLRTKSNLDGTDEPDKLESAKQHCDKLEAEKWKLADERPNRPEKNNEEFEAWTKEFKKLEKRIITKYQSFERLETFCRKHPVVEQIMSMDEIDTMEGSLEQEVAKIPERLLELENPDDEFKLAESKFLKLKSRLEDGETNIANLETEIESSQSAWKFAEEQLDNTESLEQPASTEEEVIEFLESLENRRANYDVAKQRLKKINLLKSQAQIQEELSGLVHIPNNPDCWACQKQPWKIKEETLRAQLTDLNQQIDVMGDNSSFDVTFFKSDNSSFDVTFSKSDDLEKWIQETEQMEAKSDQMEKLKRKWLKYKKYRDQREKQSKAVKDLRRKWENADKQLKVARSEHRKLLSKFSDIESEYNSLQTICQNRERWNNLKEKIATQRASHESQERNQRARDLHDKYLNFQQAAAEWDKHMESIQTYQAWERQKSELESQLQEAKNQYEIIKSATACFDRHREVKSRLVQINAELEKVEQYRQWRASIRRCIKQCKRLEYWNRVKSIRGDYQKKSDLIKKIDKLQKSLQSYITEEATLVALEKQYTRILEQKGIFSGLMDKISGKRMAVDHIREIFSGFKQWLYAEKVIPKLVARTNKLVDCCLDGDCRLMCETNPDGTFDWLISEKSNISVVRTAGGFREFLYGLAIRITLSYLGATSVACHQMFIDEGFVASSESNLSKVPDFIRGLLGVYDSIILVTHLNQIKECGYCIDIDRVPNKKLSLLRFGDKVQHQEIVANKVTIKPKTQKKTYKDQDKLDKDQKDEKRNNKDEYRNNKDEYKSEKDPKVKKSKKDNQTADDIMCDAKLKSGKQCPYRAKAGTTKCGKHSSE